MRERLARAGHPTEVGEALGLVHGRVQDDGDQEHEADHGAGPEALHEFLSPSGRDSRLQSGKPK
jgi:hypothetical protein